MEKINFSEHEVFARTLYGEARGELATVGRVGLEAVASVIWNRWQQNPRRYGDTLKEVCLQPYQFSCWNQNDPNYVQLCRDVLAEVDAAEACKAVAKRWIEGEGIDVTKGANHYYARWMTCPSWGIGRAPIAEIGVHRFYRL